MAINWQKGTLFAGGLALGVAAGVWGVMSMGKDQHAAAPPQRTSTSTMGAPAAASGPAPLVAVVAAPPGTCEQSPILAKAADGDGRETLQTKVGTATASEVGSMILSGKEAAAAGHPRDAEVAFLNACRNAASLQGKDNIALADAMYQLGRHYANVGALGAAQPRELYERAERLYSASLAAYTTRYGANHEKTKFAQAGLTTVLQATGGSGVAAVAKAQPPAAPAAPTAPVTVAQAPAAVQAAPAPAPVAPAAPPAKAVVQAPPPAPKVAPAPPPVIVQAPVTRPAASAVAAAAPAREAPRPATEAPVARRTSPSFDCARARSTTEKLICGDEELARMDRELGGMHQRAKLAAADPRAFQRQSDAEWKNREDTCRDADCLRRWYAQRRQDLAAAVDAPRPQARVAESRPAPVIEAPVAQAAPRPMTPVRPRLREIAPDNDAPRAASGDTGISAASPMRPRRAREVEIAGPAQAEGSPNAPE
jgi:hypothetical protein